MDSNEKPAALLGEVVPQRKGIQFHKENNPNQFLSNPTVVCYVNQALYILFQCGHWWARTCDVVVEGKTVKEDDEIGDIIIRLLRSLQQPSMYKKGSA